MKRREFLTKTGITVLALPLVSEVPSVPDLTIHLSKMLAKFDGFSNESKQRYINSIRQIKESKPELFQDNFNKNLLEEMVSFFEKRMRAK